MLIVTREKKRYFDFVFSIFLLVLTAPVLLPVLLMNVFLTRGHPIFIQRRAGKNGVEYGLLKLRTMRLQRNGESWSHRTELEDGRLTTTGKLIRRTYLDELPQLINVIFGHMSIVGPRPETLDTTLEISKSNPRFNTPMWNGERMRMGNNPDIDPGPADTFQSYDLPWANASNTPFRLHKRWTHEGGISTPALISWPAEIMSSEMIDEPTHIVDIAATIYDVTGTEYPTDLNGSGVTPLEGRSFSSAIRTGGWIRTAPIFWEHEGNRAVRLGDWKLVSEGNNRWELYNMKEDRTELNDLADDKPEILQRMIGIYGDWAKKAGALPWPVIPSQTASPRPETKHIHDVG